MKPPRGLTPEEAAAWERLTRTVSPLDRRPFAHPEASGNKAAGAGSSPIKAVPREDVLRPPVLATPPRRNPPGSGMDGGGLDSHWDRRIGRGAVVPDFTLDLHGASLDSAHDRLQSGLAQARSLQARVVLLIAGKSRPTEAADRGQRRGAIRAKVLDWLAAGPHADAIAAVRPAHRRHGGAGALYIVLRRSG